MSWFSQQLPIILTSSTIQIASRCTNSLRDLDKVIMFSICAFPPLFRSVQLSAHPTRLSMSIWWHCSPHFNQIRTIWNELDVRVLHLNVHIWVYLPKAESEKFRYRWQCHEHTHFPFQHERTIVISSNEFCDKSQTILRKLSNRRRRRPFMVGCGTQELMFIPFSVDCECSPFESLFNHITHANGAIPIVYASDKLVPCA